MPAPVHSLRVALIFAVALFGLAAPPATAQSLVGSIFGKVTDPDGTFVPGVTVTVSGSRLIQSQSDVSNNQGGYRFVQLPAGLYTIVFELSGFQTLKREGVALQAGQSLALDVQLSIAQLQETITVSGEAAVVDTRNAALTNALQSDDLKTIPLERESTRMLNIMPGVSDSKYSLAPMNAVHGGSVRQNVYSLDGMTTNDSNTGSSSTTLPVDALQEVQLTTAGVPAEYSEGAGAVFTFVSKSGGDQFSGGANFYTQGLKTQSDNLNDALRAEGLTPGGFAHSYDSGFFLGGPVKRRRVWFFGNYRYVNQAENRSDFPVPLNHYDHQLFAKATVQVSNANSADFGFSFRDRFDYPYVGNANFRTAGDRRTWSGLRGRPDIYTGRWTSVINNTVIEARGGMLLYFQLGETPDNDGSPAYQEQNTGVFTGGSDLKVGPVERNRNQLKVDVSHFREKLFGGSHSFKTGLGWQNTPMLATNYFLGARSEAELDGCESCLSAVPDALHLLLNDQPFRVQLWGYPSARKYQFQTMSAYVQDQWVIRDRVTLNIGGRIDHVRGVNNESFSGGGKWEPQTVFSQNTAVTFTNVVPRLGVVWDLNANHTTTLKATAGRFYADLVGNLLRDTNPGTAGFREYDWVDRNNDRMYQPGEEGVLRRDTRPDPNALPRFDPNFKSQFTDVFTVGVERQLAADWAVTATGIFKREGNMVGLINASIPFSAYNQITVTNPVTREPLQIYTLRPEFVGVRTQLVATNPGDQPGDPAKLTRKYDGLELVVHKRLSHRWQMQSSYVLGRGLGNVSNSFAGSNWVDYQNPNAFVNRYGDITLDQRHQIKIYGAYEAPYGIRLSGASVMLSGLPLSDNYQAFVQETPRGAAGYRFFRVDNPQILTETFIDVTVERPGTRRHAWQRSLDLSAEKRFRVPAGTIGFSADIFNVFNTNPVVRVKDLRLDSPNFNHPAEVFAPRQLRVGVRWDF